MEYIETPPTEINVVYERRYLNEQEIPLEIAKELVPLSHQCPIILSCSDRYEKTAPSDRFIVYVDMVGDLFHSGHMNALRQATLKGRELSGGKQVFVIVGVCSDEDCAPYKRLPMNTLAERVAAVSGCRFTDAIIFPAPLAVNEEVFDNCKIDLVVHGDDFNSEKMRKYYGYAMDRGAFASVPYTQGISTTELIKRIQDRAVAKD